MASWRKSHLLDKRRNRGRFNRCLQDWAMRLDRCCLGFRVVDLLGLPNDDVSEIRN